MNWVKTRRTGFNPRVEVLSQSFPNVSHSQRFPHVLIVYINKIGPSHAFCVLFDRTFRLAPVISGKAWVRSRVPSSNAWSSLGQRLVTTPDDLGS